MHLSIVASVNKCPAFEFGCSWIGHGGSEYQNHCKECEFAKLAPLYTMLGTITTRLNELDNKMNQIDNKITQMEDKISSKITTIYTFCLIKECSSLIHKLKH